MSKQKKIFNKNERKTLYITEGHWEFLLEEAFKKNHSSCSLVVREILDAEIERRKKQQKEMRGEIQ